MENAPLTKPKNRKSEPKRTAKGRRALARTSRPGASRWTRSSTAEKDEGEDDLIPRYTYTAVTKSSHTRGDFLDEGVAPEPWAGFYIRGADTRHGVGARKRGWVF